MSLWQIDSPEVFYLRFLFVCACGWMLYVRNLIKEIDTEFLKGRTNWKHLFCPPKLFFPTTFFPTPKWDLSAWVFSMHNWFENPHVRGRMLASWWRYLLAILLGFYLHLRWLRMQFSYFKQLCLWCFSFSTCSRLNNRLFSPYSKDGLSHL